MPPPLLLPTSPSRHAHLALACRSPASPPASYGRSSLPGSKWLRLATALLSICHAMSWLSHPIGRSVVDFVSACLPFLAPSSLGPGGRALRRRPCIPSWIWAGGGRRCRQASRQSGAKGAGMGGGLGAKRPSGSVGSLGIKWPPVRRAARVSSDSRGTLSGFLIQLFRLRTDRAPFLFPFARCRPGPASGKSLPPS